ncbi:MAG: hypothetical protein ACRDQ0_17445 [Pseudonocardia sp.]
MRELGLPLFVDGDHLAVLDREGEVVRLPLTGDGAVTALAPYRYSSSESSSDQWRGTRTWSRVGDRWSGTAAFPRNRGAFAEVGVVVGKGWRGSVEATVEWGIVALDRDGNVLLRIRPLRNLGQVRRFAQDCGLEFIEEQITDPRRLAATPELVTSTAALLSKGTRKTLDVAGSLLAVVAGLLVLLGMGVAFVALAVVAFLVCRPLFRWLLVRGGVWIAVRRRSPEINA